VKTQQNQHTQEYSGISAQHTGTHTNADEDKVDSGEKISIFFCCYTWKAC